MADLSPSERLQPSLLDRLTDDEPDKQMESADKRVIGVTKLREVVLRDLAWLMSCGNLATIEDLSEYPEAERSVVNFGVPDLTGLATATLDPAALEDALRQAILAFEPRIIASGLRVEAVVQRDQMNRGALAFQIEGQLWGQPVPTVLNLRTELDLETHEVRITPQAW